MTHISPDPPVDSTLDALLTRTLGSGQLSATRKRHHRERLGLTAGAFTGHLPATRHIDAPDASGSTRIVTSTTSSGPFRGHLELITVATVLILVLAGVVLYRSLLSNDDGRSASGGSPAIAFVSLVKEGTHEFGRVTVVDVASGNELFTAETASDVDAAVSPDGSTLYVADGWDLIAYDLASGDERWRARTELRLSYMPGFDQPSTLAVAPRGDRIFVYMRAFLEEGRYADQYEVPYWLQVVDANSGQTVASTEEIVGCGAARMSFSPAGDILYVLCSTHIQVVALDVETLEINEDSYLPGLGSELLSSILYRTAGAVSYADGRKSLLVRNEPGDNTFSVTLLDDEEGTSERVALGVGGEDGTVARGSIALLDGDTRLVLGVRTEIEFIGQTYVGDVDQIRVFNTTTWEEISRIDLEAPLHIANVAVDGSGNAAYGARWESVDDNSNDSTVIYRMKSDGTVEQAFVREGEAVLRMFVIRQGSGNKSQHLPSSTPTPPGNSDNAATPQPSTGLLIYTFDEAQEMTPFELVQPEYVPEQLEYHGLNVRQTPGSTGESNEVTLSYFPTDTDLPSAMPIAFRQTTQPYAMNDDGYDETATEIAGRSISVYRQEWEPDLDHVIWVWQEAGIHYSIEALIPDAGLEPAIEELIAALPVPQTSAADATPTVPGFTGSYRSQEIVSDDGTTVVSIIRPERQPSVDEHRSGEDITIVLTDGVTGDERARFHPPEYITWTYLSADGSRLVLQSRLIPGGDQPWNWFTYDTGSGELLSTIQRDSRAGYDEIFLSDDGTRMYRAWNTPSSATTDPEPLRIHTYDTTTGDEIGMIVLDHVPAGAWNQKPDTSTLMTDLLVPAAAMSPDGRQIAIVHADVQAVTLVDVESLTIERILTISGTDDAPDPWFEREQPRPSGVEGREHTTIHATYSADGTSLHIQGYADLVPREGSTLPVQHDIGPLTVELEQDGE